MIPEPAYDALLRWFPPELLRVPIVLGRWALNCVQCGVGQRLEPVAASFPDGRIHILPEYWAPDTAAGVALIAHELCHQQQFARMGPQVLSLYAPWDEKVARGEIYPWQHPLEAPCYRLEAEVYSTLLAEGWPPGPFVPLGYQVWG